MKLLYMPICRFFWQVSPLVCFLGILFFPIPTQPVLWASSPHIHIQPGPPFFSPNQLTIFTATPLTWENRTREVHSIIADDCLSGSGCSFDSGIIRPDHRYVLSQLGPGHYPYHCGLHPFMRGLVIIHHSQPLHSDI
jgi:plastocyanin